MKERCMNYLLMPIRIPAGWEIFNNRLYQIGNIDKFISENNTDEVIYHLDTGLLTLLNYRLKVEIYVDWYPAMDINGAYHLAIWLEKEQSHQELFHYSNRNIEQLINILEEKLLNINSLL